ncbi:MAG: DUF1330 domain-containing protein [Phenylobacterium sp.]|uniref:DUF1330 domain-containing protein n=1 Tax=Phenylobacterium sp. TaxID=1871053 RepID=UPI00391B1ED8
MAAYVIFIRESMTDPDAFALYGPMSREARGDHAITPLAFYGNLEVLEGAPAEGVVVLQFPSMEAAHAWYDSPAYQAAKAQRMKGADYRVLLVEGV